MTPSVGEILPARDGTDLSRSLNQSIWTNKDVFIKPVTLSPRPAKAFWSCAVAPPKAKLAPREKVPPPRYGGTSGSPSACAASIATGILDHVRNKNKERSASSFFRMRPQTDEVDDQTAVAVAARRLMEVGDAPWKLADGGVGKGVDEVSGVLQRVAEAEDGREAGASMVDAQKTQECRDEEEIGVEGHCSVTRCLSPRPSDPYINCRVPKFLQNMARSPLALCMHPSFHSSQCMSWDTSSFLVPAIEYWFNWQSCHCSILVKAFYN